MIVVAVALRGACMAGFLCSVAALANPLPSFQGLGDLPGGDFISSATGLSADGSFVVGHGTPAVGYEAFRWTAGEGMIGLGDLPGGVFNSGAYAVSADGSVVVGFSYAGAGTGYQHPFRWTEAEGMVDLGDLPGGLASGRALDISDDGLVIVGHSDSGSGAEAFRWTVEQGMVGLGFLPGGFSGSSGAGGVSTDGSVIVGVSSGTSGRQAFRWTPAQGMVGLGFLPGAAYWPDSDAHGVSTDGSVVVGWSDSADGYQAFRWTAATGMVGLGQFYSGDLSYTSAKDVSADGSLVVGYVASGWAPDLEYEALIWDAEHGLRRLQDVLEDEYALDLSGWTLEVASAISDDGRTLVGCGTNPAGYPEAWIARIPEPQTLTLTVVGLCAMRLAGRRS